MDQQNRKALAVTAGFLIVVLFKVKSIVEYLKRWIPDRSRSDPDVYSALDNYKRDLFWHLRLLRHSQQTAEPDEISILEVCYNPLLAANYKYFPRYAKSTIICEDRSLRRVSEKRTYMTVGSLETLKDYSDNSFDAIVVTFMLCASLDLRRDIHELHRVIIDGGHLYFLEHEPFPDEHSSSSYNPFTIVAEALKSPPYSIEGAIKAARFLRCEVVQTVFLPQFYTDRKFVLGFAIK